MRRLFPLFLFVAMAGCGANASTTEGPKTPANTSDTSGANTNQTNPPDNGDKTGQTSGDGKTADGKTAAGKTGDNKPAFRDEPNLTEPAAAEAVASPLPAAPKGLPEAPKTCSAFVSRKPTAPAACAEPQKALEALDKALSEAKADKRDALLAGLESCAGLPPSVARALRAEMAPIECADVLVEPLINAPPKGTDASVYATLRGLATAARLSRTGSAPPKLAAPYDKARVKAFITGPMATWMSDQANAIQALSGEGSKLSFYARGVAAMEAGMADLRVVEAVRAVPLPTEFAKDQELKNVYYAELDQVLDPRKDRGRDATLVGMRDLAFVGVLRDARIDRARGLLSRLYGGRRIDALDTLLVPPLGKLETADVKERLAAKLPTFYAGILLGKEDAKKPSVLRAFLERGVPLPQRVALKGADLTPDQRRLYARARLELGRVYLRALDFDQAAQLLAGIPEGSRNDEDVFVAALVAALRNGPEDAAVMVRSAPVPMLGMGDIKGLDAIAKAPQKGPFAGIAAFDAAVIKQITAPIGADAVFFRDVASRFREAAGLLGDAAQKKTAEDRAKAADETAKAIH